MKNETITGALGISEDWLATHQNESNKIWNECERISDALEKIAQTIKQGEFDCEIPLSSYEKKLILSGFVLGRTSSMAELEKKMHMMKGLSRLFEEMGKLDDEEDEDED